MMMAVMDHLEKNNYYAFEEAHCGHKKQYHTNNNKKNSNNQMMTPRPPSASLLSLMILLGCSMFGVEGFAYAPNFITKIIEEQTSISPRGLLSIGDTPLTTTTTPTTTTTITTTAAALVEEETGKVSNHSIIKTRFPPEPNGYLHLGHAKAISFNFEVGQRIYGGQCHMRLDDTNPSKEDIEYVNSILEDVIWIQDGLFNNKDVPWDGPVRKTSDYFEQIYRCAIALIESGDAYVDSLTADEMKAYRGTLTEAGQNSPYRNRSIAENRQLFQDMKDGKYPDGAHVVRAKIDMSSSNINMRDPTLYRIKHESHPETGDTWCIYPMYDFSHPISDSIEGITHSLCTLEFEDHRPFYDWTIDKLVSLSQLDHIPQQIEFSRLNMKYTVLSKRKLIQLVSGKYVMGWDDPRMPTLSGIRRRGISPYAIRTFCERIGISKSDSNIDYTVLEDCIRECMDQTSPRLFGVLHPLKITIMNYDHNKEVFMVDNHPKKTELGQRLISFSNAIYIERDDFFDVEGNEGIENGGKPPKGYKRLMMGQRVRLRYAYVIECRNVIRNESTNEPIELQCFYYPETKAGVTPQGMERVQGIIHWVDATTSIPCKIHQYDRLFMTEEPGKVSGNFLRDLNPHSSTKMEKAQIEASVYDDVVLLLQKIQQEEQVNENYENTQNNGVFNKKKILRKKTYPSSLSYQFERSGYYALDKESTSDNIIFNRVVTLRDTWGTKRQGHGTTSTSTVTTTQSNNNETPMEDIRRIAFRVATLVSVDPHPQSDKLIICTIDCGEGTLRTIVAGLGQQIDMVKEYIGQKVVAITNFKPVKLVGIESTAMLLIVSSAATDAAGDDDENMPIMDLLSVPRSLPNGELLHFDQKEPCQPDIMLKSKGAMKVWDRVQQQLTTNELGQVTYCHDDTTNQKHYRMISNNRDYVTTRKKIMYGTIQ